MEVGFIGLGHMGAPMALNLLKAGHRVIVYNRTRSKAEALAAKGAQIAERVTDTCRGQVLITMLSDDAAVEAVMFGCLSALGANGIHVSMSTINVALSDHLTEAHRNAGQAYATAPVFGRPKAAAVAELFSLPLARTRCSPVAGRCSTRSARGPSSSAPNLQMQTWSSSPAIS
jgi:3-hydroxyisobutyrate dehydrogenase-like beta-hydroxyacid dehydrogenase